MNVYDLKIAFPGIFNQFSVRDDLFVYYKCPHSERIVKPYNHYNEILFTLSGQKAVPTGGKTWNLTNENSLLLRRTPSILEMHDNLDWEVIAFHFDDEFLMGVYQDFIKNIPIKRIPTLTNDVVLNIKINSLIRLNFYGLLAFFSEQSNPSEYVLELKLKELLISILSEPQNALVLAYFDEVNSNHKNPLRRIMEANYMFNLTIQEYARMTNRSVATFRRDFKYHYHMTPGKWLIERRLTHARENMIDNSKRISQIAFDSGFENLSHFSRIFKEKYGKSPKLFRNITH